MSAGEHSPAEVKSWRVEVVAALGYRESGTWQVSVTRGVDDDRWDAGVAVARALEECPLRRDAVRELRVTPEWYA